MENRDALTREAEELADGMTSQKEMLRFAFICSYVANHELRALWQRFRRLEKLIMAFGVPILLSIITGIIAIILKG